MRRSRRPCGYRRCHTSFLMIRSSPATGHGSAARTACPMPYRHGTSLQNVRRVALDDRQQLPIDLGIAAVARQRSHHIQPQILRRDNEGHRISGRPLVRGAAGAAARRSTSLPQAIKVARLVVITSDSSLRWSACTSRSTLIMARTSACEPGSEVSGQNHARCPRAIPCKLKPPTLNRRRKAGSDRSSPW